MHTPPNLLDLQYNPLLSVGDVSGLFRDWEARSTRARVERYCVTDLHYGASRLQTLDIFPAPGRAAPVLVFIHGGYWRGSDKQVHSFLAPAFQAQGAVVVLVNYELCPAVTLSTICTQIAAALDWVHAHIASYGEDPRQVVLAGHSAGAHLAAMALLRTAHCARALCLSGLFDLAPLSEAPFLKKDLALDASTARTLSPVNFRPPPGLRVTAAVGALESEAFHRQSARLQASWGRAVVPTVRAIAGRHHFDILNDLATPGTVLHADACALLFDTDPGHPASSIL